MKRELSNVKLMNWLFIFVFLISIIVVFIVNANAKKQEQEYLNDYMMYQHTFQLREEGKTGDALHYLDQLLEKYPKSYTLLWEIGLTYSMSGDNDNGIKYLEEALEQRPLLTMNPLFTAQLGELYMFNNEFAKSRAFLEQSLRLDMPEEIRIEIYEILDSVNKSTSNK